MKKEQTKSNPTNSESETVENDKLEGALEDSQVSEDSTDSMENNCLDHKEVLNEENSKSISGASILNPSAEEQLKDINSKYLYAMAELDNTRKRHIKERSELLKYAGENLARDFLEVLDDLERAAAQPISTSSATVLEGVNLISNRMRTLFERYGIKSEECLGDVFDPKKHEAVTMSPSSAAEAGKILQQISRCYFFKDKLLRPAQVIVGSGENAVSKD